MSIEGTEGTEPASYCLFLKVKRGLSYGKDSFSVNGYLNNMVDLDFPWLELSPKCIDQVARFQNLCLPPDSAILRIAGA